MAFVIRFLKHWGGIALVAVGIVDSSFIPLPGGADLCTALLSILNKNLWLYYSFMSTIGSLAGAYLTFRLGAKGGEKALEQRVPRDKLERINGLFGRWGFGTVFFSAIVPPPFPATPFITGAGALNYPTRKFLTAFGLGRALRFTVLAYVSSIYGRVVLRLLRESRSLWSVLLIIAVVAGAAAAIYLILRKRRKSAKA
jgi:membrane protein DedA with SNARE-associated domain